MGRHRDTGAGTRPKLLPSGEEVHSHRRPPGVARARAVSLVAVGALAGGVAIASTTAPWSRDESHAQPEARPGGPSGTPGTGPGVLPVPSVPSRATEGPVETVAVPAPAPTLAPTVPTEPPVLAGAPAPAVWRADGPGAFVGTSWNTVGATPPDADGDEVSFQLTGRGQRSELEPALPAVHEGDQHDLTFSMRLDGEFVAGSTARQVVARWENDGPGQAPLDLRVNGGELVLHGGEGHPSGPRTFTRTLGRAPVGEWTQLRVLVRFSADPDKAGVSVWRDGRPVVDDDHPRGGTLYPGQQSYLKVGLHRDRTIASPSAVRFRAWRIDHGRAAADPDRQSPTRGDTVTTTRRPTNSSDGDRRSTGSGPSDRRAPETDAPAHSGRDVSRQTPTAQRTTSPNDVPDRDASGGAVSEHHSTGSSESDQRSSRSDTSHRRTSERSVPNASDRDAVRPARTAHRETPSDSTSAPEDPEDNSASDDRSEPSRRTSPHDESARSASDDAGSQRGSSPDGASTDTDARGSDEPGERSSGR